MDSGFVEDTPRPQAWYTRHPDPPWGVTCKDCGDIGGRGMDKTVALLLADRHAFEVHGVEQPTSRQIADTLGQDKAQAERIMSFAISTLRLQPGDVLVIKAGPDYSTEELWHVNQMLTQWREAHKLDVHILVVPLEWDMAVVQQHVDTESQRRGW